MQMAIDYNAHSIWLSAKPVEVCVKDPSAYVIPPDEDFFYIGGESQISYSNSYNASTMGIYSQKSQDAYFIDGQSGSVSQISVSQIRDNPGIQEDDGYNNCSNAKVIECLRDMRQSVQLKQGAYILRIYNGTQNLQCSGRPYDIPVFLNTYQVSHNFDKPNAISLSFQFIRRCPVQNLNIGITVREGEQ